MIFKKELELIDKFCEWLDKRNCQYKRELRKGSYHNEGYIDIMIKLGKIFIGIEAKLNGFQSVLFQASGNSLLCHYSYILYPRYPKSKWVKKLKEYKIGLIIYNSKTDKFEIPIKAKKTEFFHTGYIIRIKRNWKEDRIGRHFRKEEIPENYSNEEIEALIPNYSWVKSYKEKKVEELREKYKTLDKF